jgi:hypothetical protein
MKQGMLWQDSQKGKAFAQKIAEAKKYFIKKYGFAPNVCHVNPTENEHFAEIVGIEIVFDKLILPNCYWLGTNDNKREYKRVS